MTLEAKKSVWMKVCVVVILAAFAFSFIFTSQFGDEAVEKEEEQLASAAEGPYYEPSAQPPTSVQIGGKTDSGVAYGGIAWGTLQVGYVGTHKVIQDSTEVYIPRLGNDIYSVAETNVTVKRLNENGGVMQTLTGKALVFANARNTPDAGYVMVSIPESRTWVSVLNGNPNYVFTPEKSNIYSYTIKKVETGEEIIAYNLADLAVASGGAGDPPPGDGLTKIRDNLYLKRDGFIATPRPTGGINLSAPQSLSAAAMSATSSATFAREISSDAQPKYLDESGKKFANVDELLLVFAQLDENDAEKLLPMAIHKADSKIYGVKKLDKETATITVGEQIGEVTRTEGLRIFFKLEIFPELKDQELSVEVQR